VPDALRGAGLDGRVHDDLSPQGTEDVVWLHDAGAHRWVVLTRDDRIRYNQLEREAALAAKLRFYSITSSSLKGDEAAALILSAVRAISRLCRHPLRSHAFRTDTEHTARSGASVDTGQKL
jgi:hypothetical protein